MLPPCVRSAKICEGTALALFQGRAISGMLTSVAVSPDGRYLATLGRHADPAIRLFDAADFRVV